MINQLDAQSLCFYNKFISCRYMFRAHVLIFSRSKLHYTASGIITLIGGRLVHRLREDCVMQFWPPDDVHMCSKHVEAWNKLIVKQKFCASSWLSIEINIQRCMVSKMLKKNSACFGQFLRPSSGVFHCTHSNGISQWWANYGPRARYGPLKCSIRPARHYS